MYDLTSVYIQGFV